MIDQYFEAFLADTPEGKEINYRIRYHVYCLETGYEDPSNFPDRRETDEDDSRSAHFIVRARATGDWIAAMRLVLGPMESLPISRFAMIDKDLLLRSMHANSTEDFAISGEVSRMSVIAQYRRRPLERNTPYQIPWDADDEHDDNDSPAANERRKAPWLMLALLYAARDYSEQNAINHWFFLAARSLARIFRGLGMQLEQTGPECEHRGTRFPHVIEIPRGFDNFEVKYPRLAQTIPTGIRYKLFSELKKEEYKSLAAM
jgi:N-acyl amino acid synthase of PEP-CTERM/exosortase system